MECFRCLEKYDVEVRRPKLLACGHVFCQQCLESANRCFSDDKAFSKAVDDLPDDLYTLGLLRTRESEDVGVSVWCHTCAAAASESCLDSQDDPEPHVLHSMRRHRHEVLLQHLEKLLAVLDRPSADSACQEDEVLAQLASNGEVEVSYGGEGGLSATVQLGGSCAEDSEVAWAMQQLLLRLPKDAAEALPDPPRDPPAKFENYVDDDMPCTCFGIFDDGPCPEHDADDDDDTKAALLGLMNLDDDEEYRLDLSVTANPGLPGPEELLKVRRLVVNLAFNVDPQRTLKLLEEVAPHLEELELYNVDRAHLEATLRMPKLWRLEVYGEAMCKDPFVVPGVLPHDGGLRVLHARLSPSTVASLVRAHRHTLESVVIKKILGPRRKGPPVCHFEDLDYRGGGEVAMQGFRFKRNPYFPTCERGDFPVLKSVEFDVPAMSSEGQAYNGWGCIAGLETLVEMLPGVHIGTIKSGKEKNK